MSGKRKRDDEYSTNPNTVKANKRVNAMTAQQKEVHDAKAKITKAINRCLQKLRNTTEWTNSTAPARELLEKNAREEVHKKYRGLGTHPDQVAAQNRGIITAEQDDDYETIPDTEEDVKQGEVPRSRLQVDSSRPHSPASAIDPVLSFSFLRTGSLDIQLSQFQPEYARQLPNTMKTIGFLGGMSYHSTALYYTSINGHIQRALGGAASAPMIMHSFNHAETSALFSAGQWDAAADKFITASKQLKEAGAQGLAIGCNIGHKVAERVEAEAGLPLLHIADATAAEIKRRGLSKIGLLATSTVMEEDFIRGRLSEKAGVEVLIPDHESRLAMDKAIFEELGAGIFRDETRARTAGVVDRLIENGAEVIVLACTELQFIVRAEDVTVPLLDTMELHAQGIADWVLAG